MGAAVTGGVGRIAAHGIGCRLGVVFVVVAVTVYYSRWWRRVTAASTTASSSTTASVVTTASASTTAVARVRTATVVGVWGYRLRLGVRIVCLRFGIGIVAAQPGNRTAGVGWRIVVRRRIVVDRRRGVIVDRRRRGIVIDWRWRRVVVDWRRRRIVVDRRRRGDCC